MQGFYGGLTVEDVNPDTVAATVADESCTSLPTINKSLLVDPGKTQERSRILAHAAEVLNFHHKNVHLSPAKLRRISNQAGTLAKYTTIIGPWNAYHKASCRFDSSDPGTVEDYYIAAGALVFELSMMQYQVYYGASFKAVNVASHTRAYRTIHSTFGDDVFGLAMSVSHWTARGSLESASTFVRQQAIAMNISVDESSTNVSRLANRFSSKLGRSWSNAVNSYTSAKQLVSKCHSKVTSHEDGGFFDLGEDLVDWVGDAFDTDVNVSKTIGDIEGIKLSRVSDETLTKIKQCVGEKSE